MSSESVQLPIGGMVCATCVGRVEKALVATPGVVNASVNFATETATVRYAPGAVDLSGLRNAVEAAGYQVRGSRTEDPAERRADAAEGLEAERSAELWRLRLKFSVSLAVGLGLMLLGFFPPAFLSMEQLWVVMFALATPVQFWAGAAVLPGRLGGRQAPHHRHEHPDRRGHLRGLLLHGGRTFFPGLRASRRRRLRGRGLLRHRRRSSSP